MPLFLTLAGVNGAAAMIALSFAAHAAERSLPPDQIDLIRRGAELHLWHALALLGIAALSAWRSGGRWLRSAALAFQSGILLFCGSLYWLGAMGPDSLGPLRWVTPLGGLALIAGWLLLVAAGLSGRARRGSP